MCSRSSSTLVRCSTFVALAISGLWCVAPAGADAVTTVGTLVVDADHNAGTGSGAYDPQTAAAVITETGAEYVAGDTITINSPAGFSFNTAAAVTATPTNNLDLGGGANVAVVAGVAPGSSINATQIQFTVAGASAGNATITVTGIELRADNCAAAVAGDVADIVVSTTVGGAGSLSNAQFVDVTVTAGVAAQLAFTVEPSSAAAYAVIAPPIVVEVRDMCSNQVASATNLIAMTIQNNPGGGALGGTTVQNADGINGQATFNNLFIDKVGTGYTLRAVSSGLTAVTSAAFNITPDTLNSFLVAASASSATAGAGVTITLTARDAYGNAISNFDPTTDITISTTTAGAVTGGPNPNLTYTNGNPFAITDNGNNTATIPAAGANTFNASGQYTFTLTNFRAEGPVAVMAASGAAQGATATGVTWAHDVANRLRYVQQPTSTAAGATITPPVQVEVLDQYYNRVTTGGPYSVTLTPSGGALAGTNPQNTASGVATFADLSMTPVGAGYTLQATSGGLTPATSSTFDITAPTNLVADSLTLDAALTATLTYSVDGAATVGAYGIQFYLDTNSSATFDPPNDTQVGATQAGQVAPGSYTATQSFAASPPASGQWIFAVIDQANTVVESSEYPGDNVTGTANAAGTDLIATAVSVTTAGSQTNVSVSYTVSSPAAVNPFVIRLGLDANADGAIESYLTGGSGQPSNIAGDTSPGAHDTAAVDVRSALNAIGGFAHGARLYAVVDFDDTVAESNPNNNRAYTQLQVDLMASGLTAAAGADGAFTASLTYTVSAQANVAAFTIRIGRDTNGDGAIDNELATVAGDNTPGTHQLTTDLSTALAALGVTSNSSVTIVAVLDSTGQVTEFSETNNSVTSSATYSVDLVATRLTFPGTALGQNFDATVEYNVTGNRPMEDFTIGFYVSANDSITSLTGDTRIATQTVTGADKSLGAHSKTYTLNVPVTAFPNANFFLKARLNDAADGSGSFVPGESAGNNIVATPNSTANPEADFDGDGLTREQEDAGLEIPAGRIFRADQSTSTATPAASTRTFDTSADTDGDGLSDKLERDTFTNPNDADSDGDGLNDGDEDANHNGVVDAGETDPRNWDTDGDGLSDKEERDGFLVTRYPSQATSGRFQQSYAARVYSNPGSADTDSDGISDWNEVNTYARAADPDGSVPSAGLRALVARAGRTISKTVPGIRTDPSLADSDADGLPDPNDPAPQINPARWGFDTNGDGLFDDTDLATLRAAAGKSSTAQTSFPATLTEFQALLLNFDQDGDGFLEAPDANGDGFPDFTRYNEATLEQAFAIDFSNDGTLTDGFDVGGLNQGQPGPQDSRCGSATENQTLYGTYRILAGGDGTLDTLDSTGQLIPTDNCPTRSNQDQLDFDGDGLGDSCDADLDNDGIENKLDPLTKSPASDCSTANPDYLGPVQCGGATCGFGMLEGLVGCLVGMAGVRWTIRRR